VDVPLSEQEVIVINAAISSKLTARVLRLVILVFF